MDSLVGRPAPWTALWGGQLRGQPCGEAGFVDSLVGRRSEEHTSELQSP